MQVKKRSTVSLPKTFEPRGIDAPRCFQGARLLRDEIRGVNNEISKLKCVPDRRLEPPVGGWPKVSGIKRRRKAPEPGLLAKNLAAFSSDPLRNDKRSRHTRIISAYNRAAALPSLSALHAATVHVIFPRGTRYVIKREGYDADFFGLPEELRASGIPDVAARYLTKSDSRAGSLHPMGRYLLYAMYRSGLAVGRNLKCSRELMSTLSRSVESDCARRLISALATKSDVRLLRYLLEWGGDPNSLEGDEEILSALSMAIQQHCTSAARLLLEAGADMFADESGAGSPWERVQEYGNAELKAMLYDHNRRHPRSGHSA